MMVLTSEHMCGEVADSGHGEELREETDEHAVGPAEVGLELAELQAASHRQVANDDPDDEDDDVDLGEDRRDSQRADPDRTDQDVGHRIVIAGEVQL